MEESVLPSDDQLIDLEALFQLSYGMCILCSKKNEKFNGCLVNTVFQITPEPPMIAVSVNRENLTHEYITESRVFTVSVLAEETPTLFMGKFGFRTGRDVDKFDQVNYKLVQQAYRLFWTTRWPLLRPKSQNPSISKRIRFLSARLWPVRLLMGAGFL